MTTQNVTKDAENQNLTRLALTQRARARREFLTTGCVALSSAAIGLRAQRLLGEESPKPIVVPNIVIMFLDNIGYGDLACYGNQAMKTPRIDRLAAE